jgi:type VI protein secretion system component Hcp
MRNPIRAVVCCLILSAASGARAQNVVYQVDGWPRMSTRADGKLEAWTFYMNVQHQASAAAGAGGGAGRASVSPFTLLVPASEPLLYFIRASLRGEHLKTVLIETLRGGAAAGKAGGPAPFAVRLTDVLVTQVELSQSSYSGGGSVAVKLEAQMVEFFGSSQSPDGKISPASKAGYDARTGKVF